MRILRVLTRPNLGGPMRQAVALWHEHRALGHDTLLAVGHVEHGETALHPSLPADRCVVVDGLGRALTPWRAARARRSLAQLIRSFQPDVVHTHTTAAGHVGRELARRLGVRVVAHTYHGLVLRDYFSLPVSAALRAIERRLARSTDLNLAVSASCKAELAELGIQGVEVVPPAVDVHLAASGERAAARTALGVPQDAQVLGFVGRLVPIKRVQLFLATLDALPNMVGVVLGDGPERKFVTRSTNPNLKWAGADPHGPGLLAAFDALLIPSRREGFPLVVVEAAAARVPAIGFAVPGVRDAIELSGTGALVPEGSGPGVLATAVRRVLARPPHFNPALVARCAPARVARDLADRYAGALEAHAGSE